MPVDSRHNGTPLADREWLVTDEHSALFNARSDLGFPNLNGMLL